MLEQRVIASVYGLRPATAAAVLPVMREAMEVAQIVGRDRVAAFLAQVGHESGCLRYVREIWGPTPQQLRYEPTTSLAGRLGNTQPGDGERYMGRGWIQTTGRANYILTRDMLRQILGQSVPDFEAEPEQLERPYWAAMSAALFWRVKGLNRWADARDMVTLTKRINGGLNGLAHRQALYTRALGALT
jgi:putative chitinase